MGNHVESERCVTVHRAARAEVCVFTVPRLAIVVRRAGAQKYRKVTNERAEKIA